MFFLSAVQVCSATPVVHVIDAVDFLETPKVVFSAFPNRNLYDLRFREANRDLVFASRPSVGGPGGIFFFDFLEKKITKPVEVHYFEQFDLHDLAIDSRGLIVIGDRPNSLVVKPSLRFYSKQGGQIRRNVPQPFNEFNGLSQSWDLAFDRKDWFSPVLSRCDYYETYRCLTPDNYLDASVYRVNQGYSGLPGEIFHAAGSLDGFVPPAFKKLEVVAMSYAKPKPSAPAGVPYFAVNLTVPLPNPPPPTGAVYTIDPPLQRQVATLPMPPTGMVVDPLTGQLFVTTADAVYRIAAPETSLAIPVKVADGFVHASALTIDPSGNLYVMDDRAEPALAACPLNETCGNATLWKLIRGDGHMLRLFLSVKAEGLAFDEASLMPAGERNVEVPLGANVAVQFVKRDLTNVQPTKIIPMTIILDNMVVDPIVSKDSRDPLFSKNTVITYNKKLDHDAYGFIAVHLGQARIRIVPDDKTILPVLANFKVVENPKGSLGPHNEIDEILSELSHSRGIPTHFIKGQIQHESDGWNPSTYRYEPLSIDYGVLSGARAQIGPKCHVTPQHNITAIKYRDFAFSTGISVIPADRSIRANSRHMIAADPVTGLVRAATDAIGDDRMTADSFYTNNNAWWNWGTYDNAVDCVVDILAVNRLPLRFPAQTSIAASYGYLQMLWTTAIDKKWAGRISDGARNPSYLFDTVANLNDGGGSLTLGTGLVVDGYRSVMHAATETPSFDSYADLVEIFAKAFQTYNPGKKGTPARPAANGKPAVPATLDYGPGVINDSTFFLPSTGISFP